MSLLSATSQEYRMSMLLVTTFLLVWCYACVALARYFWHNFVNTVLTFPVAGSADTRDWITASVYTALSFLATVVGVVYLTSQVLRFVSL